VQNDSVILVGHSDAGGVITEAGNDPKGPKAVAEIIVKAAKGAKR
jgi:hypothetical protein